MRESLSWRLEPNRPVAIYEPVLGNPGERTAERVVFTSDKVSRQLGISVSMLERITYAARNRLCLRIAYKGIIRTIEPYSFRYPGTGNTLFYAWERDRGGVYTDQIKAYNVVKIEEVNITSVAYTPRFVVEI